MHLSVTVLPLSSGLVISVPKHLKEKQVDNCSTASQASLVVGSNLNLHFFFFTLFPENFSVPPDVTATTSTPASSVRPSAIDLPPSGIVKGMHKASNRSSLMDTADGTSTPPHLGRESKPDRPAIKVAYKAQQCWATKLMSSLLNICLHCHC